MLSPYQRYRLYEMLPGISIWGTLILAVVFSFLYPLAMIYFIIIFDIYWVLKVFNFSFYLIVSWIRYRKVQRIDWKDALQHDIPEATRLRHVVFLTVLNETWDVVEGAVASVAASVYNPSLFTLVIAGEERQAEHCRVLFQKIETRFAGVFDHIAFTLHPSNLPDEIPGKGSNLHYAEGEMKKYIDQRGWKYEEVIITVFDIDTVCHPNYFAYLAYTYATHPNPTKSSYQPIALYNNNMWESPSVLRIMAFGTTFWMMMSLARQDSLVTFSSHSMSFKALVDAGFHDKRIVSEDSRIFYQCLLTYNGKYEVTPLYIPVSMDTVRDTSWWQSIRNLYRQQRRWAWGVEHVPFLLWEFRKKGKLIPWYTKFKWLFIEWEGKWSWCLAALLITILGRFPLWVASPSIRQSALYFNAPHLLEILMTAAMSGLILSAMLSLPLLPPRPQSHPRYRYVIMVLQWILLPVSMLFVAAAPGIDAVTHLMRGKYLGFNISQKKR
ncbi:MAG: glycosyltransferase [Candidatus Magasanikbacteria bacterium]|nr:glycosyltransferase [Candidatus Magasanikbacteria bacterium]